MSGYKSKEYAEAFANIGEIQHLPKSRSWVITRDIANTPFQDAIGCYPLFSCSNWEHLSEDLQSLSNSVIAFSLVTDPFGAFDQQQLEATFPDVCKPFKSHYILDLEKDIKAVVKTNHLRNAKKALKTLRIEQVSRPIQSLENWTSLYGNLVKRHNIQGIAKFSDQSFQQQLETPGIFAYKAIKEGNVVGMALFYEMENTVYYHLGAYNEAGYANRASFGIFLKAIQDFKSKKLKWLNLGSGAGLTEGDENGLVRFKKGWSSDTRTAWFCGKILNQDAYQSLTINTSGTSTNFFPAYRSRL